MINTAMNTALNGVLPWWPFAGLSRGHGSSPCNRDTDRSRPHRTLEEKYRGMRTGAGPAADVWDIVRDLDKRLAELEARDRK